MSRYIAAVNLHASSILAYRFCEYVHVTHRIRTPWRFLTVWHWTAHRCTTLASVHWQTWFSLSPTSSFLWRWMMQRQGFSAPSVCCVEVLQLFDPNPVRYTFCHILVNECRFHIFFLFSQFSSVQSVSSHIKLVWFIHCILSVRPLLVYTLLVYQTISSSNIKCKCFGGFLR